MALLRDTYVDKEKRGDKSLLIDNLQKEMEIKHITIYRLSKLTDIRYELLRRVFRGERKLTAEEFILILDKTGIRLEDLK